MLLRLTVTSLLALAFPAISQAPSAWTARTFPGAVTTSNIQQRGKVLIYQEGSTFHAYSALTRSWDSVVAGTSSQLRVANDLAVIQAGSTFYAFASYSGRFQTLSIPGSPQVVNPGAQINDSLFLIRNGGTLWSVSGFDGQWSQQAIDPTAQIAVQRHTAIVANSNSLLGRSAFRPGWVSLPLSDTISSVAADGSVGIAIGATRVYGFSALRANWSSHPVLFGNVQFRLADDVAVWWDDVTYLGFSGLRGVFRSTVTGIPMTVSVHDQIAVGQSGAQAVFFSAPTATWLSKTFATTPSIALGSSLALAVEANTTHGFSAPLGTLTPVSVQAAAWETTGAVGAVTNPNLRSTIFSALRGVWTASPSDATDRARLASNGAIIPRRTGFSAYSARDAQLYPLSVSSNAVPHIDEGSAILAIEDSTKLHVFDTRRATWIHESLAQTSGLQVDIWRTSMIARDGAHSILGYGAFHGRIERLALPGTLRDFDSSSESSRVANDSTIFTFSSVPMLSSPWQYPEFRRAFASGSKLDLHLSATPSTGHAYLALGVQPPVALAGLGDVLLDPNLLIPIQIPLDARSGTAKASIDVPDLPGLRGIEVFMQALVLPTTGTPYVTDLASVLLY